MILRFKLWFLIIAFTIFILSEIKPIAKEKEPDLSLKESQFFKIYEKIFQPSCAIAGCHNGEFEPNFTSLQSSYNTLVYHPVIKNNRKDAFKYRVVPGDTAASVLFERITNCCFVDVNDRMPFYDKDGLSQEEISLIADWIKNGAKDIFGDSPSAQFVLPKIEQIQISKKSKLGEIGVVTEMFYNELGEVLAQSIDKNVDSILVNINIHQNQMEDSQDHQYFLQLYGDKDYSHQRYELPLTFIPNTMILKAALSGEIINVGELLYLRIEVKGKKTNFSFPSKTTLYSLRNKWVIIKL